MNYVCKIKGEVQPDDGFQLDCGRIVGAWYDMPLPKCPDCGGDLVWDEAGHVPGTRACAGTPREDGSYPHNGGCGSIFHAEAQAGRLVLRRERFIDAE